MGNDISKTAFGDASLAEGLLNLYAEYGGQWDFTGKNIFHNECDELGKGCEIILQTLDGNGVITDDERKKLAAGGFSDEFVMAFAGGDGNLPKTMRTEWLASHIIKKWWQFGLGPNVHNRIGMVNELGHFNGNSATALTALGSVFADSGEDFQLRYNAQNQIGVIRVNENNVKYIMPFLLKALDDRNKYIRQYAAENIATLGPEATAAVPKLIERINDEDISVRIAAIRALGVVGGGASEALPHLLQLLKSDGNIEQAAYVRFNVAVACAQIAGQATPAHLVLPILSDELHSDSSGTQFDAMFAMSAMGPAAKEAIPELIDLFRTQKIDDPYYDTFETLSEIDPTLETIMDFLIEGVKKCHCSTDSLWKAFAKNPSASTPRLIEMIKSDPNISDRIAAMSILSHFDTSSKEALETFVEAFEYNNFHMRGSARDIIRRIGAPAIPYLIKGLKGEELAAAISDLLMDMGSAGIDAAIELLKNKDTQVRLDTVEAIERRTSWDGSGKGLSNAVPALVACLDDESAEVEAAAMGALGNLHADPVSITPLIARKLESHEANVRAAAVEAIGEYGNTSMAYVSQIIERTRDANPDVRAEAVKALAAIMPVDDEIISLLTIMLYDGDAGVRSRTILLLGEKGGHAFFAVPVLDSIINEDPSGTCRDLAGEALKRILDDTP